MGLAQELGPVVRKDLFAAAHQNLVNSTVVYPHFAEEKKKSFCQESPQTKQKSQWNFNDFSIACNSSNGHFPSRRNMSREPSSGITRPGKLTVYY